MIKKNMRLTRTEVAQLCFLSRSVSVTYNRRKENQSIGMQGGTCYILQDKVILKNQEETMILQMPEEVDVVHDRGCYCFQTDLYTVCLSMVS